MRKIAHYLLCLTLIFSLTPAASAKDLTTVGPGGMIHGADVSRWQHPNDKPINFKKMHKAGLRFVMIKASDTRYEADRLALKYVTMDRDAAQRAGIYTGFYHYAVLPNATTPDAISRDARSQVEKVIGRLSSLGGYNEMDLPYALDLETRCIQWSASGGCLKNATRKAATLWSKVFLKTLKEKTGKTPFIYSSPSFLETALNSDKELSAYPLWIAQYTIDPALPESRPNVKPGGCFVHSWTNSECSANWTIWQYTSCGIAPKYGVPGYRLDLNVFKGGSEKFLSLLAGTWTPEPIDPMPRGESSTITIQSFSASTTNKRVIIRVEVKRPNGAPVVTGTVRYYFTAENLEVPKVTQTVERESSGVWTLSIAGLPAGIWLGEVGFTDETGTHLQVRTPLNLEIFQGAPREAKPTQKPTKKPSFDSCKNQIKN